MVDPANIIKGLLEDNWNSGNTDSVTPTIDKVYNKKRIDLRSGNSIILLYIVNPKISKKNGIGKSYKETEDNIAIDIRTMVSESHCINLLEETERILDNNIINPDDDYDILDPDGDTNNLHDKTNALYRFVTHCKLINTNKSR